MLILLFLVLLVVVFFVVCYMTKPTKEETDLGKRLAGIDRGDLAAQDIDPDILKREVYSDLPLIDAILQRIKLAADIDDPDQASRLQLDGRTGSVWGAGNLCRGRGVELGVAAQCAHGIVNRSGSRTRAIHFVTPEAEGEAADNLRLYCPMPLICWDAHCAPATPLRRRLRWLRARFPIRWVRNFAGSSRSKTSALPIREALLNLAKRVPVADLQFLVTAMLVQKETGGNLAEVLDKAGAVIRERSRLLGQLRIYTAQGRLTGWILGLLPFIVFALMNFVNPGYARTLIDDPTGRKAIWFGLGLMTVGVWLIRKIVDIKV